MQINNINILGVGVDGREVVSQLVAEYLLTDVYYLHYTELESSDEFYIPFPGTVSYVYGKKHGIYEVDQIDRAKLKEIYKTFHSDTIIILSLAEPISQCILENLLSSNYKIIARFPFKFENTRHYVRAKDLLKKIENRPNTHIIHTDVYAEAVKVVSFCGIKYQLYRAQGTYVATLLGHLPEEGDIFNLPLDYLCRDRVNYIFDSDYIIFDRKTFEQSISSFLHLILDDTFETLKIESSAYNRDYFHFIKSESTLNLLSFSMIILYFKKQLKVEASYMIWGSEAYDLNVLLDNGYELVIPEQLQVLSDGYNYLKSKLVDSDIEKIVGDRLICSMRQYNVEIKTTYLNNAFIQALSIV